MQVRHEHLVLSAQVESVPAGRHFLQHTLREWDLVELLDAVALAATELLTNAVVHARTPLRLEIRADRQLLVSVHDQASHAGLDPAQVDPARAFAHDLDAEGGRGLALVAALSQTWGVQPSPPGKTVWFVLPLPELQCH